MSSNAIKRASPFLMGAGSLLFASQTPCLSNLMTGAAKGLFLQAIIIDLASYLIKDQEMKKVLKIVTYFPIALGVYDILPREVPNCLIYAIHGLACTILGSIAYRLSNEHGFQNNQAINEKKTRPLGCTRLREFIADGSTALGVITASFWGPCMEQNSNATLMIGSIACALFSRMPGAVNIQKAFQATAMILTGIFMVDVLSSSPSSCHLVAITGIFFIVLGNAIRIPSPSLESGQEEIFSPV